MHEPSIPTDEEPHVFLPRKWWEWVVVIAATSIWWLLLFGVIPAPTSFGVIIVPRNLSALGFLAFAFVLGPPILVMMATRGIAWMIEQRAEAAEKAARKAKTAGRKPAGPGVKFGK